MACEHGSKKRGYKWDNILEGIARDVQIWKRGKVNQDRKKAETRIQKSSALFSKDESEAGRMVVAEMHARATGWLLAGEPSYCRSYCLYALDFSYVWQAITYSEHWKSSVKLDTRQGLVRHLARGIPCDCLKEEKKKEKKRGKIGLCHGCKKEDPVAEQYVCGNCKIECYCSRQCQVKDWPKHRKYCQNLMAENGEENSKK